MTVSFRGDWPDVQAVNQIARSRGVKTADLVRDLIEKNYGAEFKRLRTFFAASGREIDHAVEGSAGSEADRA